MIGKVAKISSADIHWNDNIPTSASHDDVYFSKENGLSETEYVFLRNNELPQRWTQDNTKAPFVIAETGFGTGLNFLATWNLWRQTPSPKRPLHFISIEKHPLALEDIIKSHAHWHHELGELSTLFQAQYPPLMAGQHRLIFEDGQVSLTLIFGDINQDFERYSFAADCWFLDGFAPSKNPDMWTPALYRFMAMRSKKEATFATFTAAGHVKRGLSEAGFETRKVPGFGRKRDMLTGKLSTPSQTAFFSVNTPNWSTPESLATFPLNTHKPDYDAIIVGSGLAGLTTAHKLAEQGLKVCILEKNSSFTTEASGQNQLAQYAKFPTIDNKEFRFTLSSLLFSQRYFKRLQDQTDQFKFWHTTGLLQLAWNEKESEKQRAFIANLNLPEDIVKTVDATQAGKLSGISVDNGGLWYPACGWLNPKTFSEFIRSHDNISALSEQDVFMFHQNKDDVWEVQCGTSQNETSQFTATYLIFATANNTKNFPELGHFPSKPLRGQVTTLTSDQNIIKTSCILCGEGYLCPSDGESFHFGATYDLNNPDPVVKHADNLKNLESLRKWLPDWTINLPSEADVDMIGKAGIRCTTPDYMPIVGQAPIEERITENFPKLRTNANAHQELHGTYYTNLYVNFGHGSKGLVSTPISAEYINALITQSPLPLDCEQAVSLSPTRFLIKELIQRKR